MTSGNGTGSFSKPFAVPKKQPIKVEGNETFGELEELVNDASSVQVLTVKCLEEFLKKLEDATSENADCRRLYKDKPERFYESELALYELVLKLGAAATDDQLLESLIDNERFLAAFLPLLNHPNGDIAGVVMQFLEEIVADLENFREESDSGRLSLLFVSSLVSAGFYGVLLDRILELSTSIDEKDHQQRDYERVIELFDQFFWITDTLKHRSEALTEGWPVYLLTSLCANHHSTSIERKKRLSFLLSNLIAKVEESRYNLIVNRGAIESSIKLLVDFSNLSIEIVEQSDKDEVCDNMVDIICGLLLCELGPNAFANCDGYKMCLMMISEMKQCRQYATKILSFALSQAQNSEAATKFIQLGGLKYLFPLFMGQNSIPYKREFKKFDAELDEEYICTMIASLFRLVDINHDEGDNLNRLLAKFSEKDGEKTRHLLEIIKRKHSSKAYKHNMKEEQSTASACLKSCLLILVHLVEMGDQMVKDIIQKSTIITMDFIKRELAEQIAIMDDDLIRVADYKARLRQILNGNTLIDRL